MATEDYGVGDVDVGDVTAPCVVSLRAQPVVTFIRLLSTLLTSWTLLALFTGTSVELFTLCTVF